MTTDEHIVSQTAVDNPGCKLNKRLRNDSVKLIFCLQGNINALRSVEPQDDHHSSDSSDGEGTFDIFVINRLLRKFRICQ
jgi:hypothetical protein